MIQKMRKYLLILSLVMATVTATAAPAKRGLWNNITLADGTTVRVQLRGDEHAHFWQDANGQNYVFDETQKAYKTADMRQLTKQALARRAQVDQHLKARRAARRADDTNGNFTGSNRGLIILAEFKDKKFAEENTRDFTKELPTRRTSPMRRVSMALFTTISRHRAGEPGTSPSMWWGLLN